MRATSVSEPAPNTYATNESDTNSDTFCLGTNFIPIVYINRTAGGIDTLLGLGLGLGLGLELEFS